MPDSIGPGSSNNILNRPVQDWLHSDEKIKAGVSYIVNYVGCLAVNISMKSLSFDNRFQIARECIKRICEAGGLKTADPKRKVDRGIQRAIGDHPNMMNAGSNVTLIISSSYLALKSVDSNQIIARHDMPRISFASGGDVDTLDFIAYVAKDSNERRSCYVLECGGELAQDVVKTIGQAFTLRYQQFIKPVATPDSHEYYNDLPGKVPPDVRPPLIPPPPIPPLPSVPRPNTIPRTRLPSTNLIDLNDDNDYVNSIAELEMKDRESRRKNINAQQRDLFDMQPFINNVFDATSNSNSNLHNEIWFHGAISRQQAECLLKRDGDFLVRESQGSPGQYVLTGIQSGVIKHLLLVDQDGEVRTKGQKFQNVSHLVNYHCQDRLPIISAESALILKHPVKRVTNETSKI